MTARFICTTMLVALCCIAAPAAHAQDMPSTPPIKMGLWESTVNSNISGITLPPDVVARLQAMGRPVPGGAHTLVSQGCMTPDEWTKTFEKMNNSQSECTLSNKSITAQKISFDMSCASQRGGVFTGHFEMTIDDDQHSHGSAHMKGEGGPNGQPMTIDTTLSSHFISADCGDIKPGSPKIIKNQ
ncbi:MAG TPA: DUF3617 domain-containing protein [Silvibacterium sp.]|nr:DUF3617 domain-containing protein [Silvibacterium sp.]